MAFRPRGCCGCCFAVLVGEVAISYMKIRYPLYARRDGKCTGINPLTKIAAFIVCRGTKCKRCLLRWNTCLTNRNSTESEVCTDTKQRSGNSRVGAEKHRWVTVQLPIRASEHKSSTLCTVIDEIGRDELNRFLINENHDKDKRRT